MKSGSQFPAQPIEMFVQQRQDERPERQMDELSHPLLKFRRIDGSNLLTATPKNKRKGKFRIREERGDCWMQQKEKKAQPEKEENKNGRPLL
jgi:hypothetical protein